MRLLIIGRSQGRARRRLEDRDDRGAAVTKAEAIEQALAVMRAKGADLVMIDVVLPVRDFVAAFEAERIRTPVVACGTGTDTRAAVAAIQAGAREYIPLPPDPELIAAVLEAVSRDNRSLRLAGRDDGERGQARRADRALGGLRAHHRRERHRQGGDRAATCSQRSTRKDRPFVSVNCAAIPDNLLESELFGHEKGAFTGAVARRIGKFEEANGGTLLLDEISEMDVRLQAKLLRAMQERVIDSVGGGSRCRSTSASSRPRTATSPRRSAKAASARTCSTGSTSSTCACRPARADAGHPGTGCPFHPEIRRAERRAERSLAAEAKLLMTAARGAATCANWRTRCTAPCCSRPGPEIGVEAIMTPEGEALAPAAADPAARAARTAEAVTRALVGRTVADVERELILDTLDHCLGNRTHAAKILGISIRTLRNKLNEYTAAGVAVPEPGRPG